MFTGLSRVYPLIGLLSGYVIMLLFNPVRVPLRDGFRLCCSGLPILFSSFLRSLRFKAR
jgi:hypothetical protein